MFFQRSKSTLDSLKGVFNVFGRKPSLGNPDCYVNVLVHMSGRKKELGEGLERFPFPSPKSFFFSFALFFPRISLSERKEQPFHYLDTLHQPTLNSGNKREEERQTVIGAQFPVIFIFFNHRFHNTFTVLQSQTKNFKPCGKFRSLPPPPAPSSSFFNVVVAMQFCYHFSTFHWQKESAWVFQRFGRGVEGDDVHSTRFHQASKTKGLSE